VAVHNKKYFLFIGVFSILLQQGCASRPPSVSPGGESDLVQIVLVGTNDFHGFLRPVESKIGSELLLAGGAEWFAGYVRILEENYQDRLVLLDAGDIFQGTLESNRFYGKPVQEYYNLLPYRAAAVGNHEFDYGPGEGPSRDRRAALKARMAESRFPFLSANIFWKGTNRAWQEKNLYPSTIVMAGGLKVGIIGLTTTSTPRKTLPQNVADLDFRDPVQPTIDQAKALRSRGADLVVALTHEGGDKPTEDLYEWLKALPAGTLDAVVSGHSHTRIQAFLHGVPVIQSRSKGMNFGRIDLFVDRATKKVEPSRTRIHEMQSICGNWLSKSNDCDGRQPLEKIKKLEAKASDFLPLRTATYEGREVAPDLAVRSALTPYFKEADQYRLEKLGDVRRDFAYLPSGESEMGELFLRAFKAEFPEAKVVYLNGGGFRRIFAQGNLTYGDLFEVHPFDNFAVMVKMNGRQLKDLVRLGVSGANTIPSLWGIRVKYHGDELAKYERDLNGDGKNEVWERDRLLESGGLVWENTGKPIGDEETFWLATNDYLVSGGDNLQHVFDPIPMSERRYRQVTQRDVAAKYLRANPNMTLPPEAKSRIERVGGPALPVPR
jgi:5'-nucleotidase